MIQNGEELEAEFQKGLEDWIRKERTEDLKYVAGGLGLYAAAFAKPGETQRDVIRRGIMKTAEKCKCSLKETVRKLFESGDGFIFMGRLFNNDVNLLQEYDYDSST